LPVEHVTAERVLLPVRLTPAVSRPEACRNLRPEEFRVLEDGVAADRVEELEELWRPTLHLVVVDVSCTMRARLEFAKRAAAAYVRSLEPDESVALFTLGDSLVRLADEVSDRDVALRAIEGIRLEVANETWDAFEELARIYAHVPARKALVAFTDGIDSGSLCSHAEAVGSTSAVSDLSVFFVAPAPPGKASPERSPELRMKSLARSTGGEVFLIEEDGELVEAFREIHRRLRTEVYVHYLPPPADPKRARADGFREVRVEWASDRKGCRVSVAKSERYAGPEMNRPQGMVVPKWKELAAQGIARDARCEVGAFVSRVGNALAGCTLDPLRDKGLYWDSVTGRVEFRKVPELALRPFVLDVPPIENLDREPGEALRRLLLEDPPAVLPAPLAGSTWLAMRDRLAAVMDDAFPAYRARARQVLKRRVEAESARVFQALRARGFAQEAAAAEAARASAGGLLRAESPSAGDRADAIAAWLGDVEARDLALSVESLSIEDLWRGAEGRARSGSILSRWSSLQAWLPAPTDRRIVVLPRLLEDPATGRVGYVRVLLPRPSWIAFRMRLWSSCQDPNVADDRVPERPLGLLLAMRLADTSAYSTRLAAAAPRVARLEYAPMGRAELKKGEADVNPEVRKRLSGPLTTAYRVRLELAVDQANVVSVEALAAVEPGGGVEFVSVRDVPPGGSSPTSPLTR
jgi:VWFA-related protein